MNEYPNARWERSRSSAEPQSLLRYYRILRARWWVVLICTVVAVAAAGVYVKVAAKTYQAQAEMEVQAAPAGDGALSTLPVLHQTGDPTEDVLTGASYVTTLPVATLVVHALHLDMSPSAALGDISASPIGQASLVAVVATTSSPELAQKLANEFVTQTINYTTAQMHAYINHELPLLTKQVATLPRSQAYGVGGEGQTLDELRTLLAQTNPTLVAQAPAALPTSPSSPKTKLTLIAGLVAGLLIGIGATFAMHAFDPRLRREEQLRDLLDVPILARIPRERRRGPLPLLPPELSVTAREGYRTLRTTLTLRGPTTESGAYLVTGSAPAEGKSTTAMSLALSLAQGGRRVILIEADLRKPTFARTFGLSMYYGTEQVLIGEVELANALQVVRFESTSIRVLAAHPSGVSMADRMSFAIVRKLIADAKAIADDIVIDSPPLTEVIDALPFAQLADEVLIVARLGYSRLSRLADLDELLAEHGAVRSGIVLIGDTNQHRYQYYTRDDQEDNQSEPRARLSRRGGGNGRPPTGRQEPERTGR